MSCRTIFRCMKREPNNSQKPKCGPNRSSLGAKIGIPPPPAGQDMKEFDIWEDFNGCLHPASGGMSVAPDSPMNLPLSRRTKKWDGLAPGNFEVFKLEVNNLPESLALRLDTQTHGVVEPVVSCKSSVFQSELCSTKPNWSVA